MSGYEIDEILDQLTLDQHFSNLAYNTEFLKSDSGQ